MAEANKTTKVTLLTPHTHAGVDYAEGDKIDVTQAEATWLEENKIITPATVAATATTTAK